MSIDLENLIDKIRELPKEDQRRVVDALEGGDEAVSNSIEAASELADDEYQQLLVRAGLLSRTRGRRESQAAFVKFQPVRNTGKPVSETIIEERG